jgi:hypothetical protein
LGTFSTWRSIDMAPPRLRQVLKVPKTLGRRMAAAEVIRRYDRRSDDTGDPARSGLPQGMATTTIDAILDRPGLAASMRASPLRTRPDAARRVHFSWDLPAFLWEALLTSRPLHDMVTAYLGPRVRLDDLYVKSVMDGLVSVSEGWHDDNVGYRLKLFMVFDTEGQPSGTVVVPTPRPHLYAVRLGDELARLMGNPRGEDRAGAVRVGYAPGDALVFDTNIPHRGDYSTGEGIRYCVIAEFIDRDKADALRGRAPCGPGQAQRRIRIPRLDGLDPAAHPLIDPGLIDRDGDGWLYGYRP